MFKKYKTSILILTLMLVLFMAIGSISAYENATDDGSVGHELNDVDNDDSLDVSDTSLNENTEKYSSNDTDTNALSQTFEDESNEDKLSSGEDDSNDKDDAAVKKDVISTNVECSSSTQQYTQGNIIYTIKLYDNVKYNGVEYKEPKYGKTAKLRVYTGTSYKTYSATVGNDGTASFKIPNLSIGTHKVEVYYDNINKATSTIKIIKASTKVYAPVKTIKYKKNTHYSIKVVDSHGNIVKNTIVKVKVFTGKKSKTYSLKTSSNGFVKVKTKSLALGTHKIKVTSGSANYKVSKSTKIYIKNKVPKKAQTLSVIAPTTNVEHKKSTYFTIEVKNYYANPVKSLKLKVKVYTGKKYKISTIKTNSKGIAKYQTKALSVGSHKVSITTTNKNYKVSKSSKIVVKTTLPSTGIEPVKLKSILYYPQDDEYRAKLTWISKKGTEYQVMKKLTGDYEVVSIVKADSTSSVFYDNVSDGKLYTYTVREVLAGNVIGPSDNGGLKLIKAPNVDVDFQNLKAKITWNKISDATKYRIFRKMGLDGEYKLIATVDAKQTSYTDYYYKSADELGSIMSSSTFIDPSFNSLVYTVRACTIQQVSDVEKVSYGLYLKDGDFYLESPSIVYLKDNKITWGKVPNAKGYLILKKTDADDDWQVIAQAGSFTSTVKSITIGEIDNNAYYSVKAFSTKNGNTVYSNFDKGFTLKNYDVANSKNRILFFGDSITFGSPYSSSSSIHIFSYAHRIGELTGCVYYNPSIPGSTYHDLGQKDGVNIENTNYYRYRICREVVDPIAVGELPGNWEKLDSAKNSEGVENTCIADYNIVVLAAGTNDYLDNAVLGSQDSADTYTFNGAFNHIMDQILTASNTRVELGLDPIKVVFVDLFYSDRTYTFKQLNNRDVTPNQIGLTLMDYQYELDQQFEKWSKIGLEMFKFDTRSYDIVNSENCPYTASDNLHFSKFTYGQYGNAMAQFLVDNVFA